MAWLNFSAAELGFSIIFLLLVYRYVTSKKKSMKSNNGELGLGLPPGPRPWPLLGNLHLLGSLPHQSMAELAKKYGPIMSLRLGSVQTVVASSPAMAKEFLKTHDLVFANRPTSSVAKYMAYGSRDVVLAPYGDYWRQMKKLCTIELLTPKRTESFRWVREEEASALVRSVWKESEKGTRSVHLRKLLYSLTLNVICRMFLGRSYQDHKLKGGRNFKELVTESMRLAGEFVLGDFIPSLSFLDWGGRCSRMKAVNKVFDEFADQIIDEHVEARKVKMAEEPDIIDMMFDMAERDNLEIEFTRMHFKAIILDMLTAATETSSTTVEWVMTELLRNPKSMAKVQQEIDIKVGRECMVKESDLDNLDYLQCVAKETFRLHPAGPLLVPHESTEGCNVGGYHIPPKTRLFVNVWAIGRDEGVWEDPLEFRPERFILSNMDVKGHHFELLPFGTGRRGCPGIHMALSVVHLVVARLIHCFDWSVEGDVNRDEVYGLTIPRKFPLCALPSWRLPTNEPP